jgi:hypothetical protein
MEWIDPQICKSQGEIFWALTEGRHEEGQQDWVIRKVWNCEVGDYRSLDSASSYRLPGSGGHWAHIIYAWLPLEAIPIDDWLSK